MSLIHHEGREVTIFSPHDSIKELHSKIGGEYEKIEDTIASKNNKLKSCESSWETIL